MACEKINGLEIDPRSVAPHQSGSIFFQCNYFVVSISFCFSFLFLLFFLLLFLFLYFPFIFPSLFRIQCGGDKPGEGSNAAGMFGGMMAPPGMVAPPGMAPPPGMPPGLSGPNGMGMGMPGFAASLPGMAPPAGPPPGGMQQQTLQALMSSDPKLAMQQAAEQAKQREEKERVSEQYEIRMAKEKARQSELAAARAKARAAGGEGGAEEPTTKRRKKNRWGSVEARKDNVVAIIPAEMKPELQEAYMYDIEVKNISKMLKAPDLGIPTDPRDRSPSPPPTYSYAGTRTNTREIRQKKKLEEQRHKLIQKIKGLDPK